MLVSPLDSAMMSSSLLEFGVKYHITNPTVLGLTQSIFLLTFAVGVSTQFFFHIKIHHDDLFDSFIKF